MPKQVDHERRRRAVAAVAADLVAAEGRRALTVRNVADAAGYSTTVVSHYFDDLADLLRLSAMIPGIASEAIFDPRNWSTERQQPVVDDELAALGIAVSGSRR